MKKIFLELVVFICGAVVMVYEIVGSRVLGPYLGTSIFIWTSLIGIILGSLSLGYWLGGRMADRNPTYRRFAWIIFASGLFILLTNLFKEVLLSHLPAILPGLKWQSVISALVLFAPASIFLGMVSPYAVKLKLKNIQNTGATVGNLYAISTIGSIAGTFFAGFFLIPLIRTTNVLFLLAGLQIILSVLLLLKANFDRKVLVPAILLLFTVYSTAAFNLKKPVYLDVDTAYNRVWIYDAVDPDSGKEARYMRINNESSSAMFSDNDSLVFAYARFYRLSEYYTPGFSKTLMLGGAAYSYPKYFLETYPEATMDVIEIDPELTRLAKEHFRLKTDPRLGIYHEDARTFVNRTDKKYDVIFGDLFRSQYTLPWQLTTLEAVQAYYHLLSEDGSMLVNIISSVQGPGWEFLSAEMATFKKVFPEIHVFAVQDPLDLEGIQSIMLVASKSEKYPDTSAVAGFEKYLSHEVTDRVPATMPVLTDELAPVDYYMGKAIR